MIKENFIKLYETSFKKNWDMPAMSDYSKKEKLHYKDIAFEITRLHILLEEAGIQKGDKIALVGKNNIPWCVAYLASITYGAVIVPILQDFHPNNIQHIIHHSDSKLLFVSNSIWEKLEGEQLENIEATFSTDSLSFDLLEEKEEGRFCKMHASIDSRIKEKYPNGFKAEDIKYADVDNSELIIINYTSGTTGFSKGVMLTANNMAGNVTYSHYLKLLRPGDDIVSFLPLAHAYGCAFEFLYALTEGCHVTLLGKAPTPKILQDALAEVKPHLIVTVPLIIEKIYKKAILPQIEKPAIRMALKVPILRENIYAKIKKGLMTALGGNFSEVIIGGAALNKDIEEFLYKIKFPFTVGYGMTECGPLISYDHFDEFVPRSCGHILDNIMEVRIDSEDPYNVIGEIQVKGENVMKGYYKNEEATKAAFTEDGWLRTGDLGTINEKNQIFIKGRSKTMLLGANGQNIFPEELESQLNNLPFILESLVVQREGKLVALVYPDYESLDVAGVDQDMLPAIMEDNKKVINKAVASYENISVIQIYPTEFEKTPKKSIKRYLYEN